MLLGDTVLGGFVASKLTVCKVVSLYHIGWRSTNKPKITTFTGNRTKCIYIV